MKFLSFNLEVKQMKIREILSKPTITKLLILPVVLVVLTVTLLMLNVSAQATVTPAQPAQAASESAADTIFVDLGNGVVWDRVSNLDWIKTPPARSDTLTWAQAEAAAAAETLDGGGWRLPSSGELKAIRQHLAQAGYCGPNYCSSINSAVGPFTMPNTIINFWMSDSYTYDYIAPNDYAYSYLFFDGYIAHYSDDWSWWGVRPHVPTANLTIVKKTVGGGGSFSFYTDKLGTFSLKTGQTGTFSGPTEQISSGFYHSCGLKPDGSADCWGYNSKGQAVDQAGPFTQISAEGDLSCALKLDGSAFCWGDNTNGQAGDHPGPFSQVAAGADFACGLKVDGEVACWGSSVLGNPPDGPFVQIGTGALNACALRADGSVICWGTQTSGINNPLNPAGPYKQIVAGSNMTCGLRQDTGLVQCWGNDSAGVPGDVFSQLSATGLYICGLRADGSAKCWSKGEVITESGPFTQVTTGGYHACGLSADGSANCFVLNTRNFYDQGQAADQPGPYGFSSQKTFSKIPTGTYAISEVVASGWRVSDISCDGGSPVVGPYNRVEVTLASDDDVTCTFEDTKLGEIRVVMEAAPQGDTQFDVFLGDQYTRFPLVDDGTDTKNSKVWSSLMPGDYSLGEFIPSSWKLVDLVCDDDNSSVDRKGLLAHINLEAGETVTCTFTNALENLIIVEKVTKPANPLWTFDFDFTLADGVNPDTPFTLHDKEQAWYTVGQGTFTITEDVPLFHDVSDIECAIIDSNNDETPVYGDLNTRSATLTLTGGELAFCRFTNTEQATLTVVKETFPPNPPYTEFQFEVYNDDPALIDDFSLQDEDEITNPERYITGLMPGNYTVKELVNNVPDWTNVNISCENEDGYPRIFGNPAYGEVKVFLDPGDDVTCTFTNVMDSKINIIKQASPDDGTEFEFFTDFGTFTMTHGATAEYILPYSFYEVKELVPYGWSLDDVNCVLDTPGGTSTFDYSVTHGVLVDLGPGEEVSCTFTNSKLPTGTINIVKDADPADDTPFTFVSSVDDQEFTLGDPTTTTKSFSDLLEGQYRVNELLNDPEWNLVDIQCVESVNANSAVSIPLKAAEIQLDPGETVTCTFSNEKDLTGTISILMFADPQSDTAFDFNSDIPGSTSFSLIDNLERYDDFYKTFIDVPAGSYVMTQALNEGWILTDVLCLDDDDGSLGDPANNQALIDLQGGEDVICVFINEKYATIYLPIMMKP